MMDSGKRTRLDILVRDLNYLKEEKLSKHNWAIKEMNEFSDGEYLLVEIEKGNVSKKFALLYTGGTKNEVYKSLDNQVDVIVINGSTSNVKSFASGISTEVISKKEIHKYILNWNGEVGGINMEKPEKKRKLFSNHIQSENPAEQLWATVKTFKSKDICKKLLIEKLEKSGREFSEDFLESKAEGMAYSIQNACDYFDLANSQKLNQRLTSLYYGAISLASAEMLSSLDGPSSLDEVEKMTKFGHGLFTASEEGKDNFENILVGPLKSGFFNDWMNFLGKDTSKYHDRRERKSVRTVDEDNYVTLIDLFSRIPELENTFFLVSDFPVNWLKVHYGSLDNDSKTSREEGKTYITISDPSCSKSIEDIMKLPFPLSEVEYTDDENENVLKFRALVTHEKGTLWFSAIQAHKGAYSSSNVIIPIFKEISEFKVISLALLYTLSIVVRYRPSIWRKVESGELEKYSVLIDEFISAYLRCSPHHFLEDILEERVSIAIPGGFNSVI